MTRVQTLERTDNEELARILAPRPAVNSALVPVASTLPDVLPPGAPEHPVDLRATLVALGIAPMGVMTIPSGVTRITVDGQPWKLTPLPPGTVCRVPPSVASRARRAQDMGVPFDYWMAEEQPKPAPRPVATTRVRRLDPILLAILPLGDGRGLVCSLGAWDHPQPTSGLR
jgi:hypothetical protein